MIVAFLLDPEERVISLVENVLRLGATLRDPAAESSCLRAVNFSLASFIFSVDRKKQLKIKMKLFELVLYRELKLNLCQYNSESL